MSLSEAFVVALKVKTRWLKPVNVSTEQQRTGEQDDQAVCARRQRSAGLRGRRTRCRTGVTAASRRSQACCSPVDVCPELGRGLLPFLARARRIVGQEDIG